jgi:hypothetical protein
MCCLVAEKLGKLKKMTSEPSLSLDRTICIFFFLLSWALQILGPEIIEESKNYNYNFIIRSHGK